ncbi:RNA dependent RNA polymerase [Diplodia seriata botourmiavirus 1]|nr:RNA dependent RNA polymerase [Diplodia seriata botourmiavirus 1]
MVQSLSTATWKGGINPSTVPTPTVRCTCRVNLLRTKETIRSGLRIVRCRFSLPSGELPDLEPADLGKYLLFLLAPPGCKPFSLPFPRSQTGWDGEGFPLLTRLGRYQRWELAQSCASIKRAIPNLTCKRHFPPSGASEWKARACQDSPPESTAEYREFCRRITRRVFPFGWDRQYESFSESYVPQASARFSKEPASAWWSSNSSRQEYLTAVLKGRLPGRIKGRFQLRYKEVPTSGKMRPLGIPSVETDLLAPLHKTMYQHLSLQSWLLKGPPTGKRIKNVCKQKYQTSVDLVGATDGLRLDVSEAILETLLAKSTSIPGRIKLLACESLRPFAGRDQVSFGQMMGMYLSFPLLCLNSYCAAKWAARGQRASFLVNGDDCIISSDSNEIRSHYPPGFVINESKTMVNENAAEINSTTFMKTKGRGWTVVRSLRRGGGENYTREGLEHLATACINAGPRWVSAFCRSGVSKASKIRPIDLGISLANHDAFRRNRRLTKWRVLPPKVGFPGDDRLEAVMAEPDYHEKFAFRELLFNQGRLMKERGPVTRTFVSRLKLSGRTYRYHLSYLTAEQENKEKRVVGAPKRRDPWFVVKDYEGVRQPFPWEERKGVDLDPDYG